MAKKLVILDADAIIELHMLRKWRHLVSRYELIIPETVYRDETVYVNREHTREHLSLRADREHGLIEVESVEASDLLTVSRFLGDPFEGRIHPGELEGLALVRNLDPESTGSPRFCTGDRWAVLALCCLDMSANAISLEELVEPAHGELRDHFGRERLESRKREGILMRMARYM